MRKIVRVVAQSTAKTLVLWDWLLLSVCGIWLVMYEVAWLLQAR